MIRLVWPTDAAPAYVIFVNSLSAVVFRLYRTLHIGNVTYLLAILHTYWPYYILIDHIAYLWATLYIFWPYYITIGHITYLLAILHTC